MLSKVIAISNVGRFRSYSASGDVQLRRYNLIFAENGRGKTTFCAILRSLSTNNPALIIGRRTLGSQGQQSVQILTDSGTNSFQNGVWNSALPDVAVFDSTYVSGNVFAGDVVETEHRRSLYRVIIGAQGIALANQITELDGKIRAQNDAIRENRAKIQTYCGGGITPDQFLGLTEDHGIDEKIAAKEQELQAVRRIEEVVKRVGLVSIKTPGFPSAVSEILAKTLQSVASDALKRVRDHVAAHRMGDRGEAWLNAGVQFVTDQACPFCGQELTGNELLNAYQSLFSNEYEQLRRSVASLIAEVDAALGDRAASAIVQAIAQNEGAVEFWRNYSELAAPVAISEDVVRAALGELRAATVSLLETKVGTPLNAVAPDQRFTSALQQFEQLRTLVGTHNESVAAGNVVIEDTKRQVQSVTQADVSSELSRLRAQKARAAPEAGVLCEKDSRLATEKAMLEQEKGTARAELDAFTERVITEYGQSINRYLGRFNAAFRITSPTHNYRGGSPSTTYQILINQSAVDLGDETTPIDRPSFKNTLSSGDRSTLALAFFLAQLDQDVNKARKVVVFDDPFTSMDAFRRTSTVHEIHRCGSQCAQIILLSHEASFLDQLWKMVSPAQRKTLWFSRIGEDNTKIAEWDIEKALLGQQRADIEAIRLYHVDGTGDPRSIAPRIRLVIEGYARSVCPTQFGGCSTMGEIVNEIRAGGTAHLLSDCVDDLDQLNLYSRRYHHPENPNASTEPIVDGELTGFARRTLELVGCL